MQGDSDMEHTLPRVKETAIGNLPCDSANSNRNSVTTERGGMGREVGRRFEGGDSGKSMADSY